MKVAIYVRVSRTDQVLENQINPLVNYCESRGYDYEIFKEKESTRKTRPVQYELYKDLLRAKYDGLIIYKFDRWARSTKELIDHMENLVERGILVYSYTEAIDLNSSMGRAMLTIISAFAQLERDIIRERTMAGLDRARAQGKTLGRPRIKRKYDKIKKVETISVPTEIKLKRKDGSTVTFKARKIIKKGEDNGKCCDG